MRLLNEFVIKGSPITRTAQQKTIAKFGNQTRLVKKKEVLKAEAILRDQLLPFVPDEPYDGALMIRVLWLFDKKQMTKKMAHSFKITRPDNDNMLKGMADLMSDMGFFRDDAQLSKVDLTKAWNKDYPGTFVQIWSIEDDYDELVMNWRNI